MTTKKPTISEVRTKGQVWTPAWVSRAMARYVLDGPATLIDEPSVGSGSLIDGLMDVAEKRGAKPAIRGTELHPDHLGDLVERVRERGFALTIQAGDFLAFDGDDIQAIVANPPYIRHHRFTDVEKTRLQNVAESTIGKIIDRRTGIQTFFLLRAVSRMVPGARGAFILPADVFEGISAKTVLRGLAKLCRFDGVATFTAEATPFPGVDTNPVVIFFRKRKDGDGEDDLGWRRFERTDGALEAWVASRFRDDETIVRTIDEAVEVGFSRSPRSNDADLVPLGALMRAVRGIATGANEYFLKTREQIREAGLPIEAFARCVGRTRDLDGDVLESDRLDALEAKGRPTHLLYLDGTEPFLEDPTLQAYLDEGVTQGISTLPLISTRNPWWKMERRTASPILFAYLGRERIRFIKNLAGALPLNGFLCIEPLHGNDPDRLLALLNDPRTTAALAYEAKSYGDGAIKVEPNAIERVQIPRSMLEEHGVKIKNEQLSFF